MKLLSIGMWNKSKLRFKSSYIKYQRPVGVFHVWLCSWNVSTVWTYSVWMFNIIIYAASYVQWGIIFMLTNVDEVWMRINIFTIEEMYLTGFEHIYVWWWFIWKRSDTHLPLGRLSLSFIPFLYMQYCKVWVCITFFCFLVLSIIFTYVQEWLRKLDV